MSATQKKLKEKIFDRYYGSFFNKLYELEYLIAMSEYKTLKEYTITKQKIRIDYYKNNVKPGASKEHIRKVLDIIRQTDDVKDIARSTIMTMMEEKAMKAREEFRKEWLDKNNNNVRLFRQLYNRVIEDERMETIKSRILNDSGFYEEIKNNFAGYGI